MKQKVFLMLALLLMTATRTWAEPITVTISTTDFSVFGDVITKNGVTIIAGSHISNDDFIKGIYGGIKFTTTLGNFTKIEVTADDIDTSQAPDAGWSNDGTTWTGSASPSATSAATAWRNGRTSPNL